MVRHSLQPHRLKKSNDKRQMDIDRRPASRSKADSCDNDIHIYICALQCAYMYAASSKQQTACSMWQVGYLALLARFACVRTAHVATTYSNLPALTNIVFVHVVVIVTITQRGTTGELVTHSGGLGRRKNFTQIKITMSRLQILYTCIHTHIIY